jgi:hypothetical protein
MWVADTGNSRIEQFNMSGSYISQISVAATGIAVDSGGNVWVSEGASTRVQEFNTSLWDGT